eukprot:scaffold18382_cov57-Attheya_sp.AAC.2
MNGRSVQRHKKNVSGRKQNVSGSIPPVRELLYGSCSHQKLCNATKITLEVVPRLFYTIGVEDCFNFTSNGLSGCQQAPKWKV